MTDLKARKAALRKELFARRKLAHEDRARLDPAANERLLAEIRRHLKAMGHVLPGPGKAPRRAAEPGDDEGVDDDAPVISGYRPIRTEIDPTPTMKALCEAGARLCVPVIKAPGLPLKFREWTPDSQMVDGPFGARVPAEGAWLEPEILIVPLVGFDREGWRLGYGGGFYDRTLERLRARRRTVALGFAYAAQELEAAPRDETDQRLDGVVTDTK